MWLDALNHKKIKRFLEFIFEWVRASNCIKKDFFLIFISVFIFDILRLKNFIYQNGSCGSISHGSRHQITSKRIFLLFDIIFDILSLKILFIESDLGVRFPMVQGIKSRQKEFFKFSTLFLMFYVLKKSQVKMDFWIHFPTLLCIRNR